MIITEIQIQIQRSSSGRLTTEMGCCNFLMVKLLLTAMERLLLRNVCVNRQIGAGRLAERGFQKTCSNISLKTNPVNIGINIKRSMLTEVDFIRRSPFPPDPAGVFPTGATEKDDDDTTGGT